MRARRKKKPNKEKWLYCIYPQGFPGKILIFTVVWKTRLATFNKTLTFMDIHFFESLDEYSRFKLVLVA